MSKIKITYFRGDLITVISFLILSGVLIIGGILGLIKGMYLGLILLLVGGLIGYGFLYYIRFEENQFIVWSGFSRRIYNYSDIKSLVPIQGTHLGSPCIRFYFNESSSIKNTSFSVEHGPNKIKLKQLLSHLIEQNVIESVSEEMTYKLNL